MLKTIFNTTREVRVEAKGDLAQAQANFATGPTALELTLRKNILATALHHLGHPERTADYLTNPCWKTPLGRMRMT